MGPLSAHQGAVKLHCLLDHDGYLPSVVVITEGKGHDVRVGRTLRLPPREPSSSWTAATWTTPGSGACYRVVERGRVPERSQIQRDEVIRLTGAAAETKCPHDLRPVEVYDPDKAETLVFVTNHFPFGATTIAAIYKDRWQVELFFKALKQNLKIKAFVGTSANALKVQVWTALIAILLPKYPQLRSCFAWSLSNLVALLHMNLFTHRHLWTWLHQPFEGPPTELTASQGVLDLG